MCQLVKIVDDDIKKAALGKEAEQLSVLRMLKAAVKNKEIALRGNEVKELTDGHVHEVIAGEIKKRKDSIDAYTAGHRLDLAEKEKREIMILEKYLPAQLSTEELEMKIKNIIASMGTVSPSDYGRAMGQVMREVKGQADGNIVSEILKKLLAK